MNQSQIRQIRSTELPSTDILECISVRIDCNTESECSQGTGTLFSDAKNYYVITAAHCILKNDKSEYSESEIQISHRSNKWPSFEVKEKIWVLPEDDKDFALMKVNFHPSAECDFDFTRIKFTNKDIDRAACIYGYTKAYMDGYTFKTESKTSLTVKIDESITATGKDFKHLLEGSSGAGILVMCEGIIYCVGFIKSRLEEYDKLDDVQIRRIPDFSSFVKNCWTKDPNAIEIPPETKGSNKAHINYNKLWSELHKDTNNANTQQELQELLDRIAEAKRSYPFPKSVVYQEQIINSLLCKNSEWTCYEKTTFALAINDRGLWPSLYGELPIQAGNAAKHKLLVPAIQRQHTLICSFDDEQVVPDESTDEGMYEMIMRDAFAFNFDSMYTRVHSWNASNFWVIKKAILMRLLGCNTDVLSEVKEYSQNDSNPIEERFIATLVYNVCNNIFPYELSYSEFWEAGIDSSSEVMDYIASRIDKIQVKPSLYGVHSTIIFESGDVTSFPESIRFLQYMINMGITTQVGIINIVGVSNWMKVYRHLFRFLPMPITYFTLQYQDEKMVRRYGQDMAYTDDKEFCAFRPQLLNILLKAIRNKHTPKGMFPGLFYLTQELYISVREEAWYNAFRERVLDFFDKEIDASNVSTTDAIYKNIYTALLCVRNIEHRREIFGVLTCKMKQNAFLISQLIYGAFWIDENFTGNETIKRMFKDIITQYPLVQTYGILYKFNRANALNEELKSLINAKIVNEDLGFTQRNYSALINVSHLAFSEKAANHVKQVALSGDMWNCGISNSSYTDPDSYHIEKFGEKIVWSEDDWQKIRENILRNINLMGKHVLNNYSFSHFNAAHLSLLIDMKLFIVKVQKMEIKDTEDVLAKIDTLIEKYKGYESLIEAFSSDDYHKVANALNLLNVLLLIDGFTKHQTEINIIISRVMVKQPIAIDICIRFIAYLMQKYKAEMLHYFANYILCMLKNLCDYDYENLNVKVPQINYYLSVIAYKMKPEYNSRAEVGYWTSDDVIKRFNGFIIVE